MSFEASRLTLAGLIEITLPSATIRLCDGGFVYMNGNKFASADPVFGAIGAVEAVDEKLGDEAPGGQITFLPASAAAAADLSSPDFQGSPFRAWLVQVDEMTGTVTGTPEMIADWELDTTLLRLGRGSRLLEMGFIAAAERLFAVNEGNVLSSTFHQSVWPGEQGMDNTTGIGGPVSWGIEGPPRGSTGGGMVSGGTGASFRPVLR